MSGAEEPFSYLDEAYIASPCSADWKNMTRTDEDWKRLCGDCNKHVHDLRMMSRKQAELLLQRASVNNPDGSICLRIYKRHDGTVLTDDCPVGLRVVRDFGRRLASMGAALLAMFGLGACAIFDPFGDALRLSEGDMIAGNFNHTAESGEVLSWKKQALQNDAIKRLVDRLEAMELSVYGLQLKEDKKLQLARAALDVARTGDRYDLYAFSKPYYEKAEQYAQGVPGSRNLLAEIDACRAKNAEKLGCK